MAILGTSTQQGYAKVIREIDPVAKAFNVQLQYLDVEKSEDIETAFRAASKGRVDGVLTLTSGIVFSQGAHNVDLAVKNRLPAIYEQSTYVEDGGLMSYGANILDLDRRAATYVDKFSKARSRLISP